MQLTNLDWGIIVAFFSLTLGIGIWVSRRAGKSSQEFFLSGRSMPWWLLGMSMVATTFSTDTPNLVTDLVRQNGVSGNWVWWAFLITGMLTVFVYARLWRRLGLTTDIEFYAIRYGGEPARFLRGLRAVFLGLFFNVLAMAGVCLAAIKIGEVMMGWDAYQTIGLAAFVTVLFSTLGGFRGVVYTDFILFFLAMAGSIGAAFVAVNHPNVGGLDALMDHPVVQDKISFFPDFSDPAAYVPILIIPLAIQWWSSWYPGGEPGGGGYVAQRMLAAKDETHALRATFFFNIAHYALRPWPWILVALASLVVFPDMDSIQAAFPSVSESKLGNDLGYPAMLTFLPQGLMGLVIASLVAAFMSTISTHLNWGASYLVHDFYRQFINEKASEQEMVNVGRATTAILMLFSALVALNLNNSVQIFQYMIMFGAGTGLLFILRWFWWRINAWSEITAMFSSGIFSILLESKTLGLYPTSWPDYWKFPLIVLITTAIWVTVTFLTPAEKPEVLQDFVKKIRPGGPGWLKIRAQIPATELLQKDWNVPMGILATVLGTGLVYSALFATGYWIYGEYTLAASLTGVTLGFAVGLGSIWKKVGLLD
ncbi:MAG: sodium:solute symporter family protein [Bacteroidota bacterium]